MKLHALGILLGALLLLAGCGPTPASAPAPPAPAGAGAASPAVAQAPSPVAREAVKIGYSVLTPANSALYTAVDGGFFERNGLDAELVILGAGQPAEAALLSGEVPAVSASPISALNAVLAGGDLVVVGSVFDTIAYQIVSTPDIGSLPELRGKTIAINRLGGSPHSALRYIMQRAGVDLDRETQVVQAGAQLERVAAVRNGAAQATLVEAPFANQATSAGLRVIADSAEMNIPYPVTSLVMTREFVRTRRDTARRILQSIVDGNRAFKADRELAIRTLSRWFKVDDPAMLDETYGYFSRLLPTALVPPPEVLQLVFDEIPAEQRGGRTLTPADLVDPSLAREIK